MDFIIELLFELIFEGVIEISKSKKVSKWIRYPLIALIIFLISALIILLTILSFVAMKENILFGILLLVFDMILIISVIYKIRKYKEEYKKK